MSGRSAYCRRHSRGWHVWLRSALGRKGSAPLTPVPVSGAGCDRSSAPSPGCCEQAARGGGALQRRRESMHVVLVGPEFEENLSLRYLAAALRQAGHTAGLARFDSPEYLEGVDQQVRREQPAVVGLWMVFPMRASAHY